MRIKPDGRIQHGCDKRFRGCGESITSSNLTPQRKEWEGWTSAAELCSLQGSVFFFVLFFHGVPGAGGALGNKTWKAPAAHCSWKAHYGEARLNCDETRGASYPFARAQTNVLMFCCRPLAPPLSQLWAVQGRGDAKVMMTMVVMPCVIKGSGGGKTKQNKTNQRCRVSADRRALCRRTA